MKHTCVLWMDMRIKTLKQIKKVICSVLCGYRFAPIKSCLYNFPSNGAPGNIGQLVSLVNAVDVEMGLQAWERETQQSRVIRPVAEVRPPHASVCMCVWTNDWLKWVLTEAYNMTEKLFLIPVIWVILTPCCVPVLLGSGNGRNSCYFEDQTVQCRKKMLKV